MSDIKPTVMKLLLKNAGSAAILLISVIFFSGCFKDKVTKTYSITRPVFKEKSEVLADIKSGPSHSLSSPGKIYLYGNYIFLNEMNKGVHVLDNSNPSKLSEVCFIDIPGNIDIAVKGSTLYADMFTDLLTIDISNPLQAKLSKVTPHVFPERQYASGFYVDSNKVIVDWITKDTTVAVVDEQTLWAGCPSCMFASAAGADMSSATKATGVGGSMARFSIVGNYLYTVNMSSLGVHDISNANNPSFLGSKGIGWNIETVYPFKDKLFIGSSNGMFIYDISNPASPARVSQFSHARACDPVVADDNYAYVTLRAGTFCMGTNNQLDVIKVDNLSSPSLLKTYSMTNPYGLAKDGDLLFICDGKDGLKLYDASDPSAIKMKKQLSGLETYDVIASDKKILLVASDGLYQYKYDEAGNMQLLSKMLIKK